MFYFLCGIRAHGCVTPSLSLSTQSRLLSSIMKVIKAGWDTVEPYSITDSIDLTSVQVSEEREKIHRDPAPCLIPTWILTKGFRNSQWYPADFPFSLSIRFTPSLFLQNNMWSQYVSHSIVYAFLTHLSCTLLYVYTKYTVYTYSIYTDCTLFTCCMHTLNIHIQHYTDCTVYITCTLNRRIQYIQNVHCLYAVCVH